MDDDQSRRPPWRGRLWRRGCVVDHEYPPHQGSRGKSRDTAARPYALLVFGRPVRTAVTRVPGRRRREPRWCAVLEARYNHLECPPRSMPAMTGNAPAVPDHEEADLPRRQSHAANGWRTGDRPVKCRVHSPQARRRERAIPTSWPETGSNPNASRWRPGPPNWRVFAAAGGASVVYRGSPV